jgi:putative sigma-54 modulation protein
MQLTVRTKDRKLTPAEDEHIRKKINRLRHMEIVADAEVVVAQEHSKRGDLQTVQITLRANNVLLRAEESDLELFNALDAALANIDRRIERFKGRHVRRRKSRSDRDALPVVLDGVEPEEPEEEEEAARPVVRTKRFTVQPMTKEDAVEQMELLDHPFFVYWDAEDKQFAVLYRRTDGTYGVLEPELGR